MTPSFTYTSTAKFETSALTDNSSINGGECAVAMMEILQCARLALFHTNVWIGVDYQLCVYHRRRAMK